MKALPRGIRRSTAHEALTLPFQVLNGGLGRSSHVNASSLAALHELTSTSEDEIEELLGLIA
jgi:hypothetical protein